jgi:hypothetical protein
LLGDVARSSARVTRSGSEFMPHDNSTLYTLNLGGNVEVKIARTRPHVQDVWNICKYLFKSRSSLLHFARLHFIACVIAHVVIIPHRIASPWCSPSKPNAASFFCFDLSDFFLFASSAFFNAKTCSTDACSKGLGT